MDISYFCQFVALDLYDHKKTKTFKTTHETQD